MAPETVFKIIIIVIFSVFSIIRIESYRLAKKAGYRTIIEESRKYSVFLSLLICYEVVTLFIYLLYPQLLMWSAISMPIWLRWAGVFLAILALMLFVWTHRSLGKNYSMKLRVKEEQNLVTFGPYRWIRHPMYTAFYILHIAAFLLISNWFIGVTWLLGLSIIIALRLKREESMMIEKFGEQYVSYMKYTGRLIPSHRMNRITGSK